MDYRGSREEIIAVRGGSDIGDVEEDPIETSMNRD